MRDIPFFTTETGVSNLVLKEIPYKGIAYIIVGDVQPGGLREHLAECAAFCRMAGAEKVYATGHEELNDYPFHTSILEMRGNAWVDPEKLCSLFPVTEATVTQWRELCNRRLGEADNSATLESRDEKAILESGGAYFVHENGKLLGIGWLADTELLVAASAETGCGERVMHTLMSLVEGASMTLEVASTNGRAIRLYEKLGFLKTAEKRRWHEVPIQK